LRFNVSELSMIPKNTVEIVNKNDAKKLLELMEVLEDQDDVQNVYANFDIDDSLVDTIN